MEPVRREPAGAALTAPQGSASVNSVMTIDSEDLDSQLRARLSRLSSQDPDYWSFRRSASREHVHSLFQYPAMMVPRMQAQLLAEVMAVEPQITSVYDPFLGSGTVLTEAMFRGVDFFGQDINPLSILLSRVKAGPFEIERLKESRRRISSAVRADGATSIEIHFKNWEKWFRGDVAVELSRIVRAIRTERHIHVRRFFWVALAETVRLTSNSRTSTYKLHIRPAAELNRLLSPAAMFDEISMRNIRRMERVRDLLALRRMLKGGRYVKKTVVSLGDSTTFGGEIGGNFDLLMTSPPYGDNETTVPYGQHSFLPLKWIDKEDIDSRLRESLFKNSHALDTNSLGGSRKGAYAEMNALSERSPCLSEVFQYLAQFPRDRQLRVAAFFRDLDKALDAVVKRLRKGACMIWVVGNRRVGNRPVPMHEILAELLHFRGARMITTLERRIPSKRMAIRNGIASTMTGEHIVVMRRGYED